MEESDEDARTTLGLVASGVVDDALTQSQRWCVQIILPRTDKIGAPQAGQTDETVPRLMRQPPFDWERIGRIVCRGKHPRGASNAI